MTSIECSDQLGENAPHKALLGVLTLFLVVFDDPPEIPIPAILHVDVDVLGSLQVLVFIVCDNIWVA